MPNQGDSSHEYRGRDWRGDVWRLWNGSVYLEWAVAPDDDSRALIDGTLVVVSTNPLQGDPSHVYVGRDGDGDIWQLYDTASGRVLQWAVAPNDDSRTIRNGTLRDIGAPGPNTVAQAPIVNTPPPVVIDPPVYVAPPPVVIVPPPLPPLVYEPPPPPPPVYEAPNPTPEQFPIMPNKGDPTHSYVGRDARGDIWQLTDSDGTIIQWAVAPNDDSRSIVGSAWVAGYVQNPPPPPPPVYQAPPVVTVTPDPGPASIPFYHPVSNVFVEIWPNWQRVGTTTAGNPVFQDRNTPWVEWELNTAGQAVFHKDAEQPGVYTQEQNEVAPGQEVITLQPTRNVQLTHPVSGLKIDILDTWRNVGATPTGNPVYQLQNEAGNWVEWEVTPSGTVLYHNSPISPGVYRAEAAAVIPGQAGGSPLHLSNTPGGNNPPPTNTGTGTTTATSGSGGYGGLLLIGGAVGVAYWLARRNQK